MKNRSTAIINDQVLLEYVLLLNGAPSNVTWTNITIYDTDPDVGTPTPIQTIVPANISTIDTGRYQAIMNAVTTTGQYYDVSTYTDLYGVIHRDVQQFTVSLAVVDGAVHKETGFSFGAPDKIARNGWGAIVTPDEIRLKYMFGIPLVSPDGHLITDEMLESHIDAGVALVERELNIDLYKRCYRARQTNMDTPRTDLVGTADIDYFWEEPYDFDKKTFDNYIYLKLRHRPLIQVHSCIMRDLLGKQIVDLYRWMKPNYRLGSLEFFPYQAAFISISLMYSDFIPAQTFAMNYYPDAFFIDYDAGFESAEHLKARFPELLTVCGIVSAMLTAIEMGEGRISGIASSSLSYGDISESFSTTASAENSLLSAKIKNWNDYLKNFFNKNKSKYSGLMLGSL